ncbi:hypothetical protein B7494_g5982 [Chlorociboria aeruginascens]|nr:hypothetical protein B7494_g5982 [Chlorociboria aeruginascens]
MDRSRQSPVSPVPHPLIPTPPVVYAGHTTSTLSTLVLHITTITTYYYLLLLTTTYTTTTTTTAAGATTLPAKQTPFQSHCTEHSAPALSAHLIASHPVCNWCCSSARRIAHADWTAKGTNKRQRPAARAGKLSTLFSRTLQQPRSSLLSHKPPFPSIPGLKKRPTTVTILSPHSIAAILSPSAREAHLTSTAPRASTPKRTHTEAFSDQPYLHPTSPTQHRTNNPAESGALGAGGETNAGGGEGMQSGQEEKKKMVRSSIACARCRRSKVKCVNTGVNSVCKACHLSNRECTYPSAPIPAPKRSEAFGGVKVEGERGESKKRVRKIEDYGRRNSLKPEDPLDSPVLTKKVWADAYEIFNLHFSVEMPFLFPSTIKSLINQACFPRDASSSADLDLDGGRVLLLALLTLTARFQPELIAYHSPSSSGSNNPSSPLLASEYYATALAAAFGPSGSNLVGTPSLQRIQALLMLGLYEWGQARGLRAWVWVGIAIRLAQSMGLAYEDDPESPSFRNGHHARSQSADVHAASLMSEADSRTDREVRRRTMWSCFIMDRMLSAGKFRPTMIQIEKLRLRLPCSENQFLFSEEVQTGFLDPQWLRAQLPEASQSSSVHGEGVLSKYIRLVEIWGRFSEWSYAGGRRTEKLPPWDPSTEFYKLGQELQTFQDDLPPTLAFSAANLAAHIALHNATTYVSLHALYSLCIIMLHREYIPFIPLRCTKPSGPLDEPIFPKETFPPPEGFWEDSAEKMFRAAKHIVDIVRTCQDDRSLPESPQMGFAIWQAAFVSVYAIHFNQMDVNGHMSGPVQPHTESSTNVDVRSQGCAGLTAKVLAEMRPRLKMVSGYLKTIEKMHQYFLKVRSDFQHKYKQSTLVGGGLEQYKTLEKELKEFGSIDETGRGAPSDAGDTADRSRASTNDLGPGPSANVEAMQGIENTSFPRPNGAWAPINVPPSTEHQYGYANYAQPQNQSPNPPSVVSPSNGDPASGLNSPYRNPQGQGYSGSNNPSNVMPYSEQQQLAVARHSAPGGKSNWGSSGLPLYPSDSYESFIGYQEAINMHTYNGQSFPMDGINMDLADLSNHHDPDWFTAININILNPELIWGSFNA